MAAQTPSGKHSCFKNKSTGFENSRTYIRQYYGLVRLFGAAEVQGRRERGHIAPGPQSNEGS